MTKTNTIKAPNASALYAQIGCTNIKISRLLDSGDCEYINILRGISAILPNKRGYGTCQYDIQNVERALKGTDSTDLICCPSQS